MAHFTVHTSWLFDPKLKRARSNISVIVNAVSGLIVQVLERNDEATPFSNIFQDGDVDLRGKFVMPGFVDAHTHVFLHSYEWVAFRIDHFMIRSLLMS